MGVAVVATWAMQSAQMPTTQAAPCPDAEVVFARGTTEAPGVGPTGEAFVDSLRSRVGAKSVGVYAVDYPATTDFPTAVVGIADARTHILATAASCPQTKMVLGGFSQGAAVMGFVTADVVPDGVSTSNLVADTPDFTTFLALTEKFLTFSFSSPARKSSSERPKSSRLPRIMSPLMPEKHSKRKVLIRLMSER